jgi:flagellar assembly factor FliW
MTVNTKALGPVEADERQKVHFPRGLLGFENFKDFVLLSAPQEPFLYLQSLDVVEIAFILIDPFLFRQDYSLDLSDEDMEAIKVERKEDALVLAIVTVPPAGGAMTANLMGPIIINRKANIAYQAILADSRWLTKHDIMKELAESGKAPC